MDADVAVVGAGVVGLACAAAVARSGRSVIVLERNAHVGEETSARNSEVIHAGLYYPTGTLKAKHCVVGRQMLYARCAKLGIDHKKIQKLVVATDPSQLEALQALHARGLANGAGELRLLEAAEAHALEPRVKCVAALLSPETGIVDSHGLMASLRAEAAQHGADVALCTEVRSCERGPQGWRLTCRDSDGEGAELEAGALINAAGLASDRIARLCGVDVDGRDLNLKFNRGDYFVLAGRLRGAVQRLIYPMPAKAGLGIHLTLDLGGELRAGPDTHWVDAPEYVVDEGSRDAFAAAVQRYLPGVQPEDLSPGYAGVRPKLAGPGESFRDFVIEEFPEAPGALHFVGIESPGLTAALALAEHAVDWLAGRPA